MNYNAGFSCCPVKQIGVRFFLKKHGLKIWTWIKNLNAYSYSFNCMLSINFFLVLHSWATITAQSEWSLICDPQQDMWRSRRRTRERCGKRGRMGLQKHTKLFTWMLDQIQNTYSFFHVFISLLCTLNQAWTMLYCTYITRHWLKILI